VLGDVELVAEDTNGLADRGRVAPARYAPHARISEP
jgi:hypothetical protein